MLLFLFFNFIIYYREIKFYSRHFKIFEVYFLIYLLENSQSFYLHFIPYFKFLIFSSFLLKLYFDIMFTILVFYYFSFFIFNPLRSSLQIFLQIRLLNIKFVNQFYSQLI